MRIEPSTNQLGNFLGKIEAPKTEPLRPFEILSGKEDPILKQRRQQQLKQQEKQKAKQAKDVAEFNRPKTKTIQTKYGVFKVDIAGAWNPEVYAQIRQEIEDDQEKSNAPVDPKFANLPEIKTEVPVDVNTETSRILGETFKALMPAPTRAVSDVVETAGKGVGEKGAELLESQNIYSQLAGLPLTIAGGIVTDVSNPLAGFVTRTGNLYDPNATAEERIGAAGNIVGYALGAMNPLEAAGAGIKAFRAGATGTEALTAAGRSLLRSSVPFGTKIDTALATKASLKNLIDVLEKDPNVFVGVSRADLTKEFADAGKTFARKTGKTAEEFYTKYLNDLADQAQPATPAQFDITAPKAPEAPAQVEDLGTVVDELVGKTEPVVPPSTIVEESDLEKLFQETVAPTLTPVKATRTRKPKAETVQTTPPANEDLGAVVNELTAQVESPVVTEPATPVVEPPVVQEPEPIAPATSVNTTPEELADPNVSVTQVPFKLDWTDKTSAQNSTNYLQRLKNLFKQNGELGIENIDDLPLLAVTNLHESNFNPKLTRAPINNKTPLSPSVYEKSIEELTYGEFKNMDWRLVPDTEANKDLIALLKQREEAFNRMVSHFKSNPGKGTTPQWKKVEELLKSRNNVIDPNDIELMDAMWELWSETSVVSEANVMFNRFYGDWFDKEKLRLFGRETKTRTKRATPGTLEQFADDQLEKLQQLAKESQSKMGANIQPEHFEFVARAVAYVISKTGLKLADALVETSKYLKQKFNFDITFDAEDIANIENKLRELNISFEVSPPPVAPVAVSPTTSKSTAPPLPTEPTVTGIPETPDEQLTSAKNRMTQEVRDEYNMDKFDEPTRRAWEESLTTAKQELQSNANAVDNVIAKVESKQAINEAEQSVLVVALSRERRNARALLEQTNEATNAEEIARLAEQTKIAEDRIDNYTNALNRAGSETARTLNARRAVIDAAEDLVSIRAKARQTYGKTLEAADEESINEIGKGLEDINKQIDDATGKGTTPVETVKANTRVKGIKESAPKLQPKADTKRAKQFEAVVNRVKEKLDAFVRPSTIETMGVPTEVDIWQPRLNDPASQAYFKQLASVQNDMGKVIQKLVTDEAIEDFDTLLTRLQADGFNITDTDLKLILSADYPTTKLYDFSDIEKEYVKMVRRQLAQEAKGSSVAERGRLIKKIQDLSQKVQAGVRKTTDKTVKTVFEENIDLQNRLDDLQAQYEGYANKLDKESQVAKARIQKNIDDLEKEIANPVLKEKLEREIPENLRQLLIERELLRRRKQQVMRKLAAEKDKRDNPSKYAMMNAFKLVNELKFGADASSLFTHGLFNAGTKESALAFKDGISAMFSEKKLSQILSEIKTNPRYQEAVDAGVAGLKERELADSVVYSNVVENVPILKSLYTPGSRFNEAFNARLRMTMYNDAANLMESRWFGAKGTKDAPTRQAIATTINNMTGAMTGKLAKSLNQNEAAREFVGVVFPTIKFLGSRFQLAFGNPALQAAMAKNPALAVYVAKKYARFGALMIGGLYGLDKVLPKDRFKIDNDPKDIKNFGKITDLQTNIVYQPFKNFLDPYKVTLGMEVMRDFMADKDENGIPIESSKPEQSFFERDETSVLANRIGTAPRATYNLLAGIASPTYESFGKNLSIRTSEGRINTVTQFAPIAGIQGAELALLKEPATQRDVDLANKLIGIVIAPSGIPISVKKDKGSKARQPVTPGVIP